MFLKLETNDYLFEKNVEEAALLLLLLYDEYVECLVAEVADWGVETDGKCSLSDVIDVECSSLLR